MAKRKRGNSEGSIYQMKDGRWRAAVMVGWKLTMDGRRIPERCIFTAATRHEVKDDLTDALKNLKEGIPIVVNKKQTVAQFLDHWLTEVLPPLNIRPKTLRTYSDIVKNHLNPGIGHVVLAKLTPGIIRSFLNAKLTEEITAHKQKKILSPRTVKHILVTLRGALAIAVKDGELARNVGALVRPPRIPKRKPTVFNADQARAFLAAVKGSRFEAAYLAGVAIGLRQGEILGLKWSDVDLEHAELTVRRALQRVNRKLVEVETKSDAGDGRVIPLPAVCVSAFAEHRRNQEGWKRWAGSRWKESGYVFTTRIGTPTDARDLLRDYYSLTRPKPKKGKPAPQLDFPAIRFHDLRHSAATLLLAQGVSARYITALLGHSQVSFTLQTYAHVLREVQNDTAAKMDGILRPEPVATKVATKTVPSRFS